MGLIDGILGSLFPPRPVPLAEVDPGERVMVRGEVVPRDVITSPLTGDRCVYYQYTVEQWRRSRVVGVAGDGFWELTERDEAICEFYLQDEGQRAIVSPLRARVERAKGVSVRSHALAIDRRGQELLLVPGDIVEISGVVERATDVFDEGRDYRSSPDRLMLRAPADDDLYVRLVERRGERSPTTTDEG